MKRPLVIGLVILLFLIATAPSYYFYTKFLAAQKASQKSTEPTSEEAKQLKEKVGKLMELPVGEEPTIATVTDADKLRSQAFFTHAQNGDRVLIFPNTKKAVLYRPSINKIIEVGPVNIGTPSAQLADQYTVVLLNGTTTTGLTRRYEEEIKEKAPQLTVSDRDNAKRSDYDRSILVDVSGTKASVAQSLANALGLTVGQLPSGEATTSSDFLIILGADKK